MRIMTERLEAVVEQGKLISDEQHGFRRDRSCQTAIMSLKYIMAKHKAKRKALHIAYLDISKAYDTVNHKQLWHVCQSYGITGKWLENLQKLYEGTRMRSLTSQGPTEEVEMKRGIRQGMSTEPSAVCTIYTANSRSTTRNKSRQR